MPVNTHRPPGGEQADEIDREQRSWQWYVDEPSGPDPVELVRALGLSTASQTTLQSDLYEQIYEALLVDELQYLASELNAIPSPKDMQSFGEYPPADYVRLFGSWTDALSTADIPTDPGTIERSRAQSQRVRTETFPSWGPTSVGEEELLDELRQFASRVGSIPKAVDMEKFGRFGIRDYIQQFGSWQAALEEAGFAPSDPSQRRVEPERLAFTPLPQQAQDGQATGELTGELRRLTAELGVAPTPTDMEKFGAFAPQQYLERFDDWEAALAAAGLTPPDNADENRSKSGSLRHTLTGLTTWCRELLSR